MPALDMPAGEPWPAEEPDTWQKWSASACVVDSFCVFDENCPFIHICSIDIAG